MLFSDLKIVMLKPPSVPKLPGPQLHHLWDVPHLQPLQPCSAGPALADGALGVLWSVSWGLWLHGSSAKGASKHPFPPLYSPLEQEAQDDASLPSAERQPGGSERKRREPREKEKSACAIL